MYSRALTDNICRTYTYSFAKNTGLLLPEESESNYDSVKCFNRRVDVDPFKAFMELEGYSYKQTLKALERYNIFYTEEQERVARIYNDVVSQMEKARSDYATIAIDDDISGTGIVCYKPKYTFTTENTLKVNNFIRWELGTQELTRICKPSNRLSKEQKEAVDLCVKHKSACLIGGAGTGKSFVTAEIIKQLLANGKTLAVLAPTHKARRALQSKVDQIREKVIVQTVHSFAYSKSGYVSTVIIDESSFLSTDLLAKLINKFKADEWIRGDDGEEVYGVPQLIFVGDKNQLEPVGYGRPFELIQKVLPVAELKENHRSEAADIIALGREILGQPQNENMGHPNIEVVLTVEEAFEKGAEVLLTFKNATVKEANEAQKIKDGEKSIHEEFSVGDKIVALNNDVKRGWTNGQLFTVVDKDHIQDSETGDLIKMESPRDLKFNFGLAYGLTVHKSQGSEWDVVAYQPSEKDTTNLAYVAVTRAKKKLIIVGDLPDTFKKPKEWRFLI